MAPSGTSTWRLHQRRVHGTGGAIHLGPDCHTPSLDTRGQPPARRRRALARKQSIKLEREASVDRCGLRRPAVARCGRAHVNTQQRASRAKHQKRIAGVAGGRCDGHRRQAGVDQCALPGEEIDKVLVAERLPAGGAPHFEELVDSDPAHREGHAKDFDRVVDRGAVRLQPVPRAPRAGCACHTCASLAGVSQLAAGVFDEVAL